MNDTLVIVPTYNEKENVEELIAAILKARPQTDLLFVDDNSPDGTGDMLDRFAAQDERVHVLHRQEKQGLGRAYIAGFKWALERHYEFIFEMDADFSHDPNAIQEIRTAAETADLALGSRYIDGIRVVNWPLSRLILSYGASIYVRIITGMKFSDPTGGFKCYRRPVLQHINLDEVQSNGYSFQIEMTHRTWQSGFHIVDVPITFVERRSGQSKMSSDIVREAVWMVWKLWFDAGLKRWSGKRHPDSVHPLEKLK